MTDTETMTTGEACNVVRRAMTASGCIDDAHDALDVVEADLLRVPLSCVYPDCRNSRRTRGLCHQHYPTMRSYVRDGNATEPDLEARGLLLAKGTGGSPVADHSAFRLGSDARGEG